MNIKHMKERQELAELYRQSDEIDGELKAVLAPLDPALVPAEGVVAIVDGVEHQGSRGVLDVTGADDIQIEIRSDGKVLWVNMPSMVFRVCCIRGRIVVIDNRESV